MSTGRKQRLKEGDVVGDRYRIEGIVGKGGFGAVYCATQLDTGMSVALKVLLANYSTSETDSRRFKREAAMVKALSHPNIVQLLDFGQTDKGVPYIAFELLHGEALNKLLERNGPLPPERSAAIAVDVLLALEVAHEVGIIHRDVKPQNVFLIEEPPYTKVLDFGIAKALKGDEAVNTQLTESGQMVGTPHYMAPEQVRGTGVFPSSDLYALGLLMAEMACGERIIKAEALIEVYMAHISDKPLPIPQMVLDSVLGPVITKATSKVVEGRYGTAAEMRDAIRALGLGAPPREAATVMMPQSAPSPPLAPSGNAFVRPQQQQNLSGTVMMEATPEAPADLDNTVNMPPRARMPSSGDGLGTVVMTAQDDQPQSASHSGAASGDGRASAAPGGYGARAMTHLTPTPASPVAPASSGAQSFMSMNANAAQGQQAQQGQGYPPSSGAPNVSRPFGPMSAGSSQPVSAMSGASGPYPPSSGMSGPVPSMQPPMSSGYTGPGAPAWPNAPTPMQINAIAMAALPARPRGNAWVVWVIIAVVLILAGTAVGVWRWAPWD